MKKFYEKIRKVLNRLHPWIEKNFDRIILILFVLCCCVVFIISKIDSNKIDNDPAYAAGIITHISTGGRYMESYKFYVDGKTYFGSEGRLVESKIKVGDSAIIRYEANNPDNNEIYCFFIYRTERKGFRDTMVNKRIYVDCRLIPYY